MPTTTVSDGSSAGINKPIKNVTAADVNGNPVPAKKMSVYSTTAGAFVEVWPLNPEITTFSASTLWNTVTLSFTAVNQTSLALYEDATNSGTYSLINSAPATGVQFTGKLPGGSYKYKLVATKGSITTESLLTAITPSIPAPTTFTKGTVAATSVTVSWTAVSGITQYQIYNGSTLLKSVSGVTSTTLTLNDSTAYSLKIRAIYTSGSTTYYGAFSSVLSFTTPSSGPSAGSYTFAVKSAYTYQSGQSGGQSAGWRSSTDDYYHGNGSSSGSTRGYQYTYFFYYTSNGGSNPFAKLSGGTCSRMEIFVKRGPSGVGSSSGQLSRLGTHAHDVKPTTPTAGSAISSLGTDATLSPSEGNWIDIPAASRTTIFNALVNGTYSGFYWGGLTTAYMAADRDLGGSITTSSAPTGTIRITIS